jgi:hypothetical protein
MQGAVLNVLAPSFSRLDAAACERVVKLTRDWQRYRVPAWEAIEQQQWQAIAIYRNMYQGVMPQTDQKTGTNRVYLLRLLNLRRAAHMASAACETAAKEWKKPVLQRTPEPEFHDFFLSFGYWKFAQSLSAVVETRVRLAGASAGVRAFHLAHKRYPSSLEEAGVGDLNVDPYTGGGFVYRVSDRGFLLYSVGPDGQDDNGHRAQNHGGKPGDITMRQSQSPSPAGSSLGEPVWTE